MCFLVSLVRSHKQPQNANGMNGNFSTVISLKSYPLVFYQYRLIFRRESVAHHAFEITTCVEKRGSKILGSVSMPMYRVDHDGCMNS